MKDELPKNCPHCGELVNYLNHKKHLYMNCENKIQVVKYKCCNKIIAACAEPNCYNDIDWRVKIENWRAEGMIVETVENTSILFGKCECNKLQDPYSPTAKWITTQ